MYSYVHNYAYIPNKVYRIVDAISNVNELCGTVLPVGKGG